MLVKSLVLAYSKAIYLDGTKRFHEIRNDYVDGVKMYVATGIVNDQKVSEGHSRSQIDNALEQGWITVEEHVETVNLMPQTQNA